MKMHIIGYRMPKVRLPHVSYDDDEHHYRRDPERDGAGWFYKKHHGEHAEVIADVMENVRHNPKTWEKYRGKSGGAMSIVEMEYAELMEDKAAGNHHEIIEELEDLAAACICALYEMKR